jgi:hypothetical protein
MQMQAYTQTLHRRSGLVLECHRHFGYSEFN